MSGIASKVGRNALVLSAAQVLNKLISIVFLVYVTRILGDAGFGKYSFVYALTSFFLVFAVFGLSSLQVREVSRDRSLAAKYLCNLVLLKTVFVSVAVVLVFTLSYIGSYDSETALVLRIFAVAMFFNVVYSPFLDTFTAFEKLEWYSGILLFNHLATVIFGFFALWRGYGLVGFSYAWLAGWVITTVVSYFLVSSIIVRPTWQPDLNFCLWMLKESWPFALSSLAFMLFFKVDTVILFTIKGAEATGWYSAAYRLLEALLFIPQSLMLAAYPTLSRLFRESPDSFRDVAAKSFRYLLVVGLPFAVGGFLVARPLVMTLFKGAFAPTVAAFAVLIWSFAFVSLREGFIQLLNAAGRQRQNFYIDVAGLTFNVIANFILIPRYSFLGAAWATVISYVFVTILSLFFYSRGVGRLDFLEVAVKPLWATATMSLIIVASRNSLPLFVVIALGALVYLAVSFMTGAIEPALLKKVMRG